MTVSISPFRSLKPIDTLFAIHVWWGGKWNLYKSYSKSGHAKNAILLAKSMIGQRAKLRWRQTTDRMFVDVKVRILEIGDSGPVIIWEDMLSNAQKGQW